MTVDTDGHPPSPLRRDAEPQLVAANELARGLAKQAWRRVIWREGGNMPLASRFAAARVRPARRDDNRAAPRPEE